jgi:hypothetical protein
MIFLRWALVGVSMFCVGCGSMPAGRISYYFPKATTQLVITQTLACGTKGTALHQVVTVTPTTTYSSDLDVPKAVLEPSKFGGTFADADVAITFTDDGRLSGINSTVTGQGSAVVKDFVSIAKAAGVFAAAAPGTIYNESNACATIAKYSTGKAGGDGSQAPPTATLTYAVSFLYQKQKGDTLQVYIHAADKPTATNVLSIEPDAGSFSIAKQVLQDIPELAFSVKVDGAKILEAARWDAASASDIPIQLNSVAMVDLSVLGPVGDLQKVGVVWSGEVAVPLTQAEDLFVVPVPKAPTFGTQKFTVGLSAYGSINKLEYSNTGTSDAADAAVSLGGALAGTLKTPTDSQQAAAIQGQADVIYQQRRLVVCQADPVNCAGK